MSMGRAAVVGFVVAFVAGFGWGQVVGVPWSNSTSTAPPTASATAPPTAGTTAGTTVGTAVGVRVPTPDDPLRVTLAGDSVMAGLAPALEAALESGGLAEVEFVLTPTILRDPTIRFTWDRQLEEFDPEVIVMFVGTWESRLVEDETGQAVPMSDAAWRPAYEGLVVDPWIELITANGAEVVWIGSPVVADQQANLLFAGLNSVFADLPDRHPEVVYLDATTALQPGRTDAFVPVVIGSDGSVERTRQIDGLHLCPAGAALLTEAVVAELAQRWSVAVREGWQAGDWVVDDEVYPAEGCPPA